MTLKQLEYFYIISKYNNITRASRELHVSQPGLSNTIKELEQEFGVSLFQRRSKGLVLTEEGAVLREEAGRLLAQARHLTERMEQLSEAGQTIRLGVPPMLAALVFPRLLHVFHQVYPGISLQMAENGTLINRNMVMEGTVDAAIISSDAPLPAAFACQDLCTLQICFYVPAGKVPRGDTFPELVQNCPVPLVCLPEDSFLTDYMKHQFRSHGLSPDILLHTNQLSAIRQLIGNETAAAFLYDQVIETDPGIVKIPLRELPRIHVRLVWDAGRKPSRAFQKLIRLCRSESFLSALSG